MDDEKSPGRKSKQENPDQPGKGSDSLKNLKSRSKLKKNAGDMSDGSDGDGSPTNKKEKKKMRVKKGEFSGGLSQDFASFDILWFDLTTKTRALVTELCQPLVDKVHSHKDLIGQLIRTNEENSVKVDELERTVYNKDNKLTIFEEIYEKIARVESERKVVEQRIENDHHLILKTFDEHNFKFESSQTQVKTMIQSSVDALAEMTQLKDIVQSQNQAFQANLKEINDNLVQDTVELREKQNELLSFLTTLNVKSQDQKGSIDQLFTRMEAAEKKIVFLDKARVELSQVKCDNAEFQENLARINDVLHSHEVEVARTSNHCQALDSYLDKYQPVRMQNMIGQTLYACLTGEERRNHELFDQDKISLLYRIILEDDGKQSSIERLIIQLNEKAKNQIDEDERRARRNGQKLEDARAIADTLSNQSVEEENQAQQPSGSPTKEAENSTLNKTLQASSRAQSSKKVTGGLSNIIMQPDEVTRLNDLVNSDFEMSANDKDYKLNHDQLIKVCKILLHKINYNHRKAGHDRESSLLEMTQQVKNTELSMRSATEEVNCFLHSVHQDLENFLKRHKKEHNELNLKVSKLSEVGHKTLDNVDQVKESVERYATILTCLLEFSSIEQALAYQDEMERNKIQMQMISQGLSTVGSKDGIASKRFANSSVSLKGAKKVKNGSNFFPTYEAGNNDLLGQDSIMLENQSVDQITNVPLSIGYKNQGSHHSKVNYRQNIMNRTQLMEMRKTLLEKCEEVIDNTSWPFIKNNLKTSKIFNDLVQFHAHDSGDLSKPLTLDVSSKGKLPIGRKGSQKPAISTRSGVTGLTGMSPSKKSGMHATQAVNFHHKFNNSMGMQNLSIMSPGNKDFTMSQISQATAPGVFAGQQTIMHNNQQAISEFNYTPQPQGHLEDPKLKLPNI